MSEQTPRDDLMERRGAVTHDVKLWPKVYDAVEADLKPWEFRKNDRDYQVGDTLHMRSWCPDAEAYDGREMCRRVVWMLPGGQFGIPEGYCIMTLEHPSQQADRMEAIHNTATAALKGQEG